MTTALSSTGSENFSIPRASSFFRLAKILAWVSVGGMLAAVQASVLAAAPEAAPAATPEIYTAPVIIDGQLLFKVRGITAFPAQERATQIDKRIVALAEDAKFVPDTIQLIESGDRIELRAGDLAIMGILDVDAQLEGVPGKVLAEIYRKRIIEAIHAYRHDRAPEVLLARGGYTLLATLALLALIVGLRWLFRRLDRLLARQLKRHIESMDAKTAHLVRAEYIWSSLRTLGTWIYAFLILVLLYAYTNSALALFPWTRGFAHNLFNYVIEPLSAMGVASVNYLPKLFFLVMLTIVVRYLLKATRLLFAAVEHERLKFAGFDPEWAIPTYRIVRLVMVAFALVLAYPYLPGAESQALKGISLLIGLLLSLGSSSVISNIIAGYTMTYRRAFKLGDWIRIGETMGDVIERRVLVTHLRTVKNEEVVIPNSVILNSEIINYSAMAKRQGLIFHTTVGIGYEVPWRQVEAMLLMAAQRTPGFLSDPPPFVLQSSLGDFAVQYELNVYGRQAQDMVYLYSELHRNIQDVFNEYGVQIMTPAYRADTAEPKTVPKSKWFLAPAKQPPASDK